MTMLRIVKRGDTLRHIQIIGVRIRIFHSLKHDHIKLLNRYARICYYTIVAFFTNMTYPTLKPLFESLALPGHIPLIID